MKRREFFKMIASTSAAYCVLRITACGPAGAGEGALRVDVRDGDTVTMYDMVIEGWSTLGSGFLGESGELKAQVVKDNRTVTLPYVQDDHGHEFTLTPEHFGKLRRGEKVSLMTTEAQGHYHEVRIDPKNKVQGSQALTMPVNPDAQPAQPADQTGGEKVYAAMPDENKSLYLTSSADLDEASVQYCADTVAKCDADQTLWQAMKRHAPRADKQIFVSERDVPLDAAKAELPLSIRGTAKKDAKLLRFVLKLVRR